MHRLAYRRAAATALLLALAAALFVLGRFLAGRGIAWASEFCGVAGFFVTIIALVLPVLIGWLRSPPTMSTLTIGQAADELAMTLARQLTQEEKIRQVNDPRPLPVHWEVTASSLAAMRGVRLDPGAGQENEPARTTLAGSFGDALSVFLRVPSRRLVILGSAGAGKSVLAMRLARELLAVRQGGGRVPVIFSAAAWDPASDLSQWMADQLVAGHPGLASRVKAVTGEVRSLASALATTGVLPIVDGLDELPADARVTAIAQINDAGSDLPLIVTSRTREYLAAIAERAISRAQVIELVPLRIAEVKDYLKEATAAAGRWEAVFSQLDAAPDGPLAAVLTTPLMLWLARTSYQAASSDPSELADGRRLPDKRSVEHHLLDGFVPAVYAKKNAMSRFACSARQARRWLAFLAINLDRSHSQDLQWWKLMPRTIRALRPISFAIRAALLFAVAWTLANWALRRVLHGHHADPRQLLSGPLGHRISPAVTYVQSLYLTPAYHALRSNADAVIDAVPWHSLWSLELWVIAAAACSGALSVLPGSRPFLPQVLTIRPRAIARGVVRATASAPALAILVFLSFWWSLFVFTPKRSSELLTGWYHMPATRLLLLLLLLWGLTDFSLSLRVPLDVSASVSSRQALALDRRATLLPIVVRRTLRAALIWLLFGSTLTLAYLLYWPASLLCRFALGSADSASGSFGEARAWLTGIRRMPWRIMSFLADAHLRGVLRQVGTGYQFRHIRLQERLSASYWEPSVPMLAPLLDLRKTLWALTVQDASRPYESAGAAPQPAPGGSSAWPAQQRWPLESPRPLPDEDYLFSCHKYPVALACWLAASFCALLATTALSVTGSGRDGTAIATLWLIFCALLIGVVSKVAGWTAELLVVTSQRIFVTSGFLTRKFTEVPLSAVIGVRLEQSFLGRLLGYGSLFFESAARDQTLRVAGHIPRPEHVLAELSRLLGLGAQDPDA